MKKLIRSIPKHINDKLKQIYSDSPMGEWMLRYERISYHELATNRTAKKQITSRSYGKVAQ
jgi:hypothetical protein